VAIVLQKLVSGYCNNPSQMKKYKYIDTFPKPFLKDLVNNRCLPFIGAGFSKNADIPKDKKLSCT